MRFKDIPQFTKASPYSVNVSWGFLIQTLEDYSVSGLELDPEFQRGHVWNTEQQRLYVEYVLRGGISSQDIYFNCMKGQVGNGLIQLVDGKQRLNAVTKFLNNELRVLPWLGDNKQGFLYSDFEDRMCIIRPTFRFHINDLPTYAEVLQWYLDLNEGGTPHTSEELAKVHALLEKERGN